MVELKTLSYDMVELKAILYGVSYNRGKEHSDDQPFMDSSQKGASHHPHSFSSPSHSLFPESNMGKHFLKLEMKNFDGSNLDG